MGKTPCCYNAGNERIGRQFIRKILATLDERLVEEPTRARLQADLCPEAEGQVEDFVASVRCTPKQLTILAAMEVERTLAFSFAMVARASLTS